MTNASQTSGYTEDELVERPAIALFGELGWETANLYGEWTGGGSTMGRRTEHEVILEAQLRPALEKLNPDLPNEAIEKAMEEITRDRSKMPLVNANQEVYRLLKEGVRVSFQGQEGGLEHETVKVIDWLEPENNHFFLASQLWVYGDMYHRRADLIGFVNGIPLVFMELKASHRNIKNAFDHNYRDYRNAIPQLFIPNALVILSNGSQTRLGSISAEWDHFFEWKRINNEGETGVVSLETVIRGVCDKARLLDIVENFTVFEEARGGLIKKVAKNHQYLGVNRSIQAVKAIRDNQGRLGVFWHTQGSGKSLSMVFFTQKILRRLPGNWTFLVVTDRDDLDTQIYKTFAACGAIRETHCQATSGNHLRELLTEDHRYVFTLIQKFRTDKGAKYPELSGRDDIIVITDEAHRSQYDIFAMNMRDALPNAAFIGFTGTPLMAGEEKTREVFGDYISIYNFAQSIEDGATVPLYYENRIPELQLINENLNEEMEKLLEEAELDEEQQEKLERDFRREYHLITRDERLDKVARDIVTHFMGRGHAGKAMVICIDKATAVKMYDKVQAHWKRYLKGLKNTLPKVTAEEKEVLEKDIHEMETMDMAVVVSSAQNEQEDMRAKGLDIVPHRKRMNSEDLEEKFKDPDDPLRMVFVCAMWITGFDVPSCSTIYLDKPMKNHTLMQTIARANRVYEGKTAGLIVDYVGVFRHLQKALAIYGKPTNGEEGPGGDGPIKDKSELVKHLEKLMAEAKAFCKGKGIDLKAIDAAEGFQKISLLDDAVEKLLESEDTKKSFLGMVQVLRRIFKAILPDPKGGRFTADIALLSILAAKINSLTPSPDISEVMAKVEDLLDRSVATQGYVIRAATGKGDPIVDLSKIDFDALRAKFAQSRKRTELERLKASIGQKLEAMVQENRSRMDYLEAFQKMIDAYNAGSLNLEEFFEELLRLAQSLTQEEQRHIKEGLSEEELAIFDILTKPEPKLTKKQEADIKKLARTLLETLKREKLVLDWRTREQARAGVLQTIETILDDGLPDNYDERLYQEKCDLAYRHIYDSYFGEGLSVYAPTLPN